jgi:predicted nuclease of predicted toxin-antitoxin system
MRFLLDMPVSPSLLQLLRDRGHEGVHANEIGHGRTSDSDLMALARREERVVVTADLHFPRLLALSSAGRPGIVLFRGGNYSDREMGELLERVLQGVPSDVLQRSICVVDKTRMRITKLPLGRKS